MKWDDRNSIVPGVAEIFLPLIINGLFKLLSVADQLWHAWAGGPHRHVTTTLHY